MATTEQFVPALTQQHRAPETAAGPWFAFAASCAYFLLELVNILHHAMWRDEIQVWSATTEGLLPEDPRLTRWYKYITLEVGLAVGAILIAAGAGLWIFGLSYWRSHNFGPLDPEKTLRIVIPGFVALILGIQVVLSSFLMSVLGLARR